MAKEILNLEATNPKPSMQKELCCLAFKKNTCYNTWECVEVDQTLDYRSLQTTAFLELSYFIH